jgi:hypothetical protein
MISLEKSANQDPIDLAFLHAAQERKLLQGGERTFSFVPFSPQTRGTEALVQIKDGAVRVTKGAVETAAEIAGLDTAARAALRAWANDEAHHDGQLKTSHFRPCSFLRCSLSCQFASGARSGPRVRAGCSR